MLVVNIGTARAQVTNAASMVSVRVNAKNWNARLPWLSGKEDTRRGSAVVITAQRLLTTAALVANAQLIQVRKNGRPPDYSATVERVDYAANLALLRVSSAPFWQGLKPMALSHPPAGLLSLTITRWRSGHFEQSAAEIVRYNQHTSPYDFLLETPAVWLNTSLQKIRDGEAAIHQNRLIGLTAYQNKNEVRLILRGMLAMFVNAGPREVFANRGFDWQPLDHPHLRKSLGLTARGGGIRINNLYAEGSGAKELRKGDVLLRMLGLPIDAEGGVSHAVFGRIPFQVLLNTTSQPQVAVQLLRNKKLLNINIERQRTSSSGFRVLPPPRDIPPDYEVFGGMVFQEFNLGYLQSWGAKWKNNAPQRLTVEFLLRQRREKDEDISRVLIISKVLSDAVNLDYENAENTIIQSVNGLQVRSLQEFRQALAAPQDQHHLISTISGQNVGLLVFSAADIQEANRRIAQRYGIPPNPNTTEQTTSRLSSYSQP